MLEEARGLALRRGDWKYIQGTNKKPGQETIEAYSVFYGGKFLSNDGQKAAIAGGIAAAHHVRLMAEHYGVPVIIHTDHAAKKLLPWIDGLLDAGHPVFTLNPKQVDRFRDRFSPSGAKDVPFAGVQTTSSTATSRSRWVSRASHTAPMPPVPR